MFVEDEERLSDIYIKPDDRAKYENQKPEAVNIKVKPGDDIILDMKQPSKVEPALRDSKKEVKYSEEELNLKRQKRKFAAFILFILADIGLLIYIIYLVITIFMNVGK